MDMARVRTSAKNLGIVTTSLDVGTHTRFAQLAESRGMTMKSFIARWIAWMDQLDSSEAAIVLDQISREDAPTVAEAVLRRRRRDQQAMNAIVRGAAAPSKGEPLRGAASPKPAG